nr:MAG TPA: hypothetical protein [Bacteriophage sp.]
MPVTGLEPVYMDIKGFLENTGFSWNPLILCDLHGFNNCSYL